MHSLSKRTDSKTDLTKPLRSLLIKLLNSSEEKTSNAILHLKYQGIRTLSKSFTRLASMDELFSYSSQSSLISSAAEMAKHINTRSSDGLWINIGVIVLFYLSYPHQELRTFRSKLLSPSYSFHVSARHPMELCHQQSLRSSELCQNSTQ